MAGFEAIVEAFAPIWQGSVLDVGCRSGNFKHALDGYPIEYCGLDTARPADVVGTLEVGLPFADMAFNTVVALDVLEHVDRIHRGISELFRVARNNVIIALPNGFDMPVRIKFLLGRRLSAKYGLPLDVPGDRHRWLFSYSEAERFCVQWAERQGFKVVHAGSVVGPRRGSIVAKTLVTRFPNAFSPRFVGLMTRKTSVDADSPT